MSAREIWKSLEARFPSESIPEAILHTLKGVKPMTSYSAKELRRLLEHVKTYVRHSKGSRCLKDLDCCATVDLIEQKLTDSLARNFRRWMFCEHREKKVNVEFLVTFLSNETEL